MREKHHYGGVGGRRRVAKKGGMGEGEASDFRVRILGRV